MRGRVGSAAIHSNSEYGIPATHDDFDRPTPAPRLLIVGASTRAAAWSAVRAGLQPVCVDVFADEDLRQVAEVLSVADYPHSLPADLSHVCCDAWMVTGAMENHVAILKFLDQSPRFGQRCGPSADAVAQLRDPAWLAERLKPLACYPETVLSPSVQTPALCSDVTPFPDRDRSPPLPRNGGEGRKFRWLRKPLASGGGRRVQRATPNDRLVPTDEPCCWQRMVPGISLSAVFAITGEACQYLFVCEQLIGTPDACAPAEFIYCGSIGPWPISPTQAAELTELAEVLIDGLDYRGLLGVDLIWDGRRFWLIEVNPRYTASCELWDLATGGSAVDEHLRACGLNVAVRLSEHCRIGCHAQSLRWASRGPILGKLILFADRDLVAPDLSRYLQPRSAWSMPWIADVPAAGSQISAQSPICTLFASAGSKAHCQAKLRRRAKRVRGWFPAR